MSEAELRVAILAALRRVAPEIDPTGLAPDRDLREAFDLDSMDILHFATELHRAFAIDIPERDYRQLTRLGSCLAYVAARSGAKGTGSV